MKRGLGASRFPSVGWVFMAHNTPTHTQEWGGKGLGRLKMVSKSVVGMVQEVQKMKHETWVACFMVPKSWVGRAWKRYK